MKLAAWKLGCIRWKLLRDFRLQFHTDGARAGRRSRWPAHSSPGRSPALSFTQVIRFPVRETLLRSGERARRNYFTRGRNRIPARDRSALPARFSTRMAGRARRHLLLLGQRAARFISARKPKKFAAFVGSPTATWKSAGANTRQNYSESDINSFRLGGTNKGKDSKLIVFAASLAGRPQAEAAYKKLGYRLRGPVAIVR